MHTRTTKILKNAYLELQRYKRCIPRTTDFKNAYLELQRFKNAYLELQRFKNAYLELQRFKKCIPWTAKI